MSEGDQAHLLRELGAAAALRPKLQLPALAITGGKGGVGKTCVAVNLGVLLARMGLKPLLVDCDLGLANADVLLGVNPDTTLHDVVIGNAPIGSAIIAGPHKLAFLPAASGREELTRLSHQQLGRFIQELARAAAAYDVLLLDTAAGIHREVIQLLACSRVVLCVVTPDPTSITDAYALIKILESQAPGADIRILVNQATHQDEALRVFNRLRQVARSFLKRDLQFMGAMPRDRSVADAVRRRVPFAAQGDCPAASALKSVALRLKGERWKEGAGLKE